MIAFSRLDQQILIDKIPFLEITSIEDMSNDQIEVGGGRKSSIMGQALSSVNFRKSSLSLNIPPHSQPTTALKGSSSVNAPPAVKQAGRTLMDVKDVDFLGRPGEFARQGSNYVSSDVISAALEGRGNLNTLQIETVRDGFNSGRTYYLRAPTENQCKHIVTELSRLVAVFKKKADVRSRIKKYQRRVRRVYVSFPIQCSIGFLIAANFFVSILDVQVPRDSSVHGVVLNLDVAFTAVFALELLINLFSHWLHAFISNPWNILDLVVILLSVIALAIANLPVSILRLVRAFRVIRLFGRMRNLKNILSALSMSIVPELNALMIMIIVISIYAIAGVTFFGEQSPSLFGTFDLAFVTLFQVAVGQPWFGDEIPRVQDDGTTNFGPVLFFVSYVLLVNWTLLQACVAVLIDNFISASSQSEMDEIAKVKEEKRNRMVMKSSLDPLLARLIKDYTDEKDLTIRLNNLFKVLDTNDSNSLSCEEFCIGVKKLNFKPRIHETESDFMILTRNGQLCQKDGSMCLADFQYAMREQIKFYAQRKLTDCLMHEDFGDAKTAQVNALKLVLHEILRQADDHASAQRAGFAAQGSPSSHGDIAATAAAAAASACAASVCRELKAVRSDISTLLACFRSTTAAPAAAAIAADAIASHDNGMAPAAVSAAAAGAAIEKGFNNAAELFLRGLESTDAPRMQHGADIGKNQALAAAAAMSEIGGELSAADVRMAVDAGLRPIEADLRESLTASLCAALAAVAARSRDLNDRAAATRRPAAAVPASPRGRRVTWQRQHSTLLGSARDSHSMSVLAPTNDLGMQISSLIRPLASMANSDIIEDLRGDGKMGPAVSPGSNSGSGDAQGSNDDGGAKSESVGDDAPVAKGASEMTEKVLPMRGKAATTARRKSYHEMWEEGLRMSELREAEKDAIIAAVPSGGNNGGSSANAEIRFLTAIVDDTDSGGSKSGEASRGVLHSDDGSRPELVSMVDITAGDVDGDGSGGNDTGEVLTMVGNHCFGSTHSGGAKESILAAGDERLNEGAALAKAAAPLDHLDAQRAEMLRGVGEKLQPWTASGSMSTSTRERLQLQLEGGSVGGDSVRTPAQGRGGNLDPILQAVAAGSQTTPAGAGSGFGGGPARAAGESHGENGHWGKKMLVDDLAAAEGYFPEKDDTGSSKGLVVPYTVVGSLGLAGGGSHCQ